MPELMQYFERFLAKDRAQVILDNAAADAARTASYLENNLGVRMHAYDLDIGELELRIGQVREQLDASKRKLDDLHVRIEADASSIKNQVELDLEAIAKQFVQALPVQIHSVDADDVSVPSRDRGQVQGGAETRALLAMMEPSPKRSSRSRTRTCRPRPRHSPSGSVPRTRASRSPSTASSTTSASTRSARSAPP
jgi:hypothetical protein